MWASKHNVWWILLVLWPLGLHALEDDRAQPIKITADSATRDERSGETRYIGSVILVQGSLRIEADELILKQNTETLSAIEATGSPARLKQKPAPDQAEVEAEARLITYDQSLDKITLSDDARIEQDGAIVTGAVIDYFVTEQRVSAGASEGASDGQRVEVVIPPSALEGN